jgi:tRNA(Ile)-lysidine synthase
VPDLWHHFAESIEAHGLLKPGRPVVAAISGGVDSMVLLHLLHRWTRERGGGRLTVAHVNHRLRGRSSDADERLVRRETEKLGLTFLVLRVRVADLARRQGVSIEMAAREARHQFLARSAAKRGPAGVALAHHADDQLELFFLRLLRGGGSDGLAGMKWRAPSPANSKVALIRPLLDVSKADLRSYATEWRIPFREDASNACLDIQRNRIRHELLPLLRKHYQPALGKTVLRTMDILGAEAEFLSALGETLECGVRSAECGVKSRGRLRSAASGVERSAEPILGTGFGHAQGRLESLCYSRQECLRYGLSADGQALDQLPVALQRRVLQGQLRRMGVEADYDLIEELRAAADKPVTTVRRLGQRSSSAVSRDVRGHVQWHEPPLLEFKSDSLELDLKRKTGQTRFGDRLVEWRIAPAGAPVRFVQVSGQELFDADKVGSEIVLRHWQPGDRFHPIGLAKPAKIQDLLTNQKIPAAVRRRLVVACTAAGEVFWVEGLRISEGFKLTSETRKTLRWRWRSV